MKRFVLWMLRLLLRLVVVGRQIAILDENGATAYEGTIISLVIGPETPPRVVIVPEGGSIQEVRRYELFDIRFNTTARRFEVESGNAVERPPGRGTDRVMESRDDDPGDRQAHREAPERDQDQEEALGPQASPDGGLDGESEGRVRPRHDADTSSEGATGGADDTGQDSEPGDPGRWGAMIRMGHNPAIPPGTLIGVSPDQHLHIMHVSRYSGGLPDGSIIWGHPNTIAWIRGNVPSEALH